MLFSSFIFLFLFFPLTLFFYFVLPEKSRNVFLLIASLIFYGIGEPLFLICMIFSILWNYFFGLMIGKRGGKLYLSIGVSGNLLLLFYFKYMNFFAETLAPIMMNCGITPWKLPEIMLPLGISFFTFQGMSYLIDVSRDRSLYQKSLLQVALYIALFPQLIAGPIIRWSSIRMELLSRRSTLYDISLGLKQFIFGLGAKVLIANQTGSVADQVFNAPSGSISPGMAWFGLTAYTLQIYFDFAGYSSMAIGIGRVFGFHFPQNFNYPYCADSISDFWRRWHISLSQWFRDYIYIPLGGNRCGRLRTLGNIMIVFSLTGLWHGANWTFLIWGLWHGILLCLEKLFFQRWPAKILRWMLTLFSVMIGWVFFRCSTLEGAFLFIRTMFGGGEWTVPSESHLFCIRSIFFVAAGCVLAFPPGRRLYEKKYVGEILAVVILFLSILLLSGSSYNPFLYFRF